VYVGIKGVKQFIAVSNQTKLDWIAKGFEENKIAVVYNGINLEMFKPSKNLFQIDKWNIPKAKIISYIGDWTKRKDWKH